MHLADDVADELHRLIRDQFPRSSNLEYAILKAHLIVEHALAQYIRCCASVLVDTIKIRRFSFSHKLEFAYLLGLGVSDPLLIPTIERLNQIRNQVAHSFVLDRVLVDEMLRINSEDYDGFVVSSDRERVKRLRWICNYLAGHISAQMTVKVLWQGKMEEALRAKHQSTPEP
jgi:uncharacterized protein YutE (UPF0331/DUF86 family)